MFFYYHWPFKNLTLSTKFYTDGKNKRAPKSKLSLFDDAACGNRKKNAGKKKTKSDSYSRVFQIQWRKPTPPFVFLSFALLSTDIPFYMAFIYCDMNVVDDEIIDFNEHQGSHYFDDEFLRFNSFHGLLFLFMRFESLNSTSWPS